LVDTYKKLKSDGKKFEIIFCSSDRDESSWKHYFEEMPWLSLPFNDKRIKELSSLYNVTGIPCLVIVDPVTSKIINPNGRRAVEADINGKDFPWHPQPLNSIYIYICILSIILFLIFYWKGGIFQKSE